MRLLVLGTGRMAANHAGHFAAIDGVKLVAGVDVDPEALATFCAGTWREIAAEPVPTNYQRFAEAVRTGRQAEPSFRRAAELQKVLDLALVADLDRKEHSVQG